MKQFNADNDREKRKSIPIESVQQRKNEAMHIMTVTFRFAKLESNMPDFIAEIVKKAYNFH